MPALGGQTCAVSTERSDILPIQHAELDDTPKRGIAFEARLRQGLILGRSLSAH